MTERRDRTAVLLERDRLYAEHMYRREPGSFGGAERVPRANPHIDRKPGFLESWLCKLLGD